MRIHKAMFVAATMALSLIGCSDPIAAVDSSDAERAVLSARVLALKASVSAAGQMNDVQRRELDDIRNDIVQWQSRSGSVDLSVSSVSYTQQGAGIDEYTFVDLANTVAPTIDEKAQGLNRVAWLVSHPVTLISRPPTPSKCKPCAPVTASGSEICFLIDRGVCNPEFFTLMCAYHCMRV